ncbi:hypothetical protein Glove_151g168 [Diversispora epigaea]|uniref:Uncharacterized protein n=1 Tax=Diversispora epigaea TaxID=1348612 RepID=A0A397J2S5_9GLOM|nr:hypothetical protein Glove_151g168 [Diversispora epigaea]
MNTLFELRKMKGRLKSLSEEMEEMRNMQIRYFSDIVLTWMYEPEDLFNSLKAFQWYMKPAERGNICERNNPVLAINMESES